MSWGFSLGGGDMPARFCVLASGSAGNCTFLQSDGFGLLIDIGLGPRLLGARLASIGASWNQVSAVLLTHTHTDHWKDLTLCQLRRLNIRLYCSPAHQHSLSRIDGYFDGLRAAGLVRPLEPGEPLELSADMTCRTVAVPHDAEPTFAFRIDGGRGLFGPQWSVGYAADLGEVRADLICAFADVNVLAIEFNHCVHMEKTCGRPRILVDRVLSEFGHLSNDQAADAVRAIVRSSAHGALRHLVQLHLSRDCNRHSLAAEHGKAALADVGSSALVTTANQYAASRIISLDAGFERQRPVALAKDA
jgi:phosphoribosyl 1,2-cyclic phosphodiesterase